MKNFTKAEIMRKCTAEAERLNRLIDIAVQEKNNNAKNNAKKALVGVKNLYRLLKVCADTCTFDSETYTKDRDFEFINIGTVAEQILFHVRTGHVNLKKIDDKRGYDHRLAGVKAEYKACLSPTSLNSPYTGKADVLLINGAGVYFIRKEDAENLVNSQGRFKYNEDYIDYVPDEFIDICDTIRAATVDNI